MRPAAACAAAGSIARRPSTAVGGLPGVGVPPGRLRAHRSTPVTPALIGCLACTNCRTSRSGTPPCRPTSGGPAGRHSAATCRSTSPSSAPATPVCGPPTTCCSATRRCASRCSRRRSSASAPAAATAAGARRCCRWASTRWPARVQRDRRPRACRRVMHETVDEVGRVVAGRGHRVRLRTRRLPQPGAQRGATAARARPRASTCTRTASPTTTTALLAADETGERCARHQGGRRHVHAALRGHPPRTTRHVGWRATVERHGRHHLRAHAGGRDLAAIGAHRPRHGDAPTSWCAPPRRSRPRCPACAATVAPIYSLMIATEPLPDVVLAARSGCASAPRSTTAAT